MGEGNRKEVEDEDGGTKAEWDREVKRFQKKQREEKSGERAKIASQNGGKRDWKARWENGKKRREGRNKS